MPVNLHIQESFLVAANKWNHHATSNTLPPLEQNLISAAAAQSFTADQKCEEKMKEEPGSLLFGRELLTQPWFDVIIALQSV